MERLKQIGGHLSQSFAIKLSESGKFDMSVISENMAVVKLVYALYQLPWILLAVITGIYVIWNSSMYADSVLFVGGQFFLFVDLGFEILCVAVLSGKKYLKSPLNVADVLLFVVHLAVLGLLFFVPINTDPVQAIAFALVSGLRILRNAVMMLRTVRSIKPPATPEFITLETAEDEDEDVGADGEGDGLEIDDGVLAALEKEFEDEDDMQGMVGHDEDDDAKLK